MSKPSKRTHIFKSNIHCTIHEHGLYKTKEHYSLTQCGKLTLSASTICTADITGLTLLKYDNVCRNCLTTINWRKGNNAK